MTQHRWIALVSTLVVALVVAAGWKLGSNPPATEAQLVRELVPAAASLFETEGGFLPDASGWQSTRTSTSERRGPQMVAHAPRHANEAFSVITRGPEPTVDVRVEGMGDSQGAWEGNAVVYRDAREGIDLVAVHDLDYLELAFVARDEIPAGELALRLSLSDSDTVREEPSTGAILVEQAGKPRLRVAAPIAIDSEGRRRTGSYRVDGERLVLAMRWEGLTPPLVIDPKLAVPVWWVLDDDRVPGSYVYDAERLSQESQWVRDPVRHRTVLVRPVRRQQTEDTMFLFGNPSLTSWAYGHKVDTDPVGGLVGELELQEWARGYALESETWEWDGTSWTINQSAHLPGLIDPAMAYDPKRGRVVLFGGAAPSLRCHNIRQSWTERGEPFLCGSDTLADVHFEYDGQDWTPRQIPGAPMPRVRTAVTWDPTREKVVLFGGRALDIRADRITSPYGRPFPDNLALDLLADTWLFDGSTWTALPTGNPPPAAEGAQLVADPLRKRVVLVAGHTASQSEPDPPVHMKNHWEKNVPEPHVDQSDLLSIWELDDTDWVERVRPGDPSVPEALRNRRAMTAFWNPVRQRVTLFGGWSPRLAICTLTEDEIEAQLAATENDPTARGALAATGCLGGFLHDTWEWDGSTLTRLTDVVYGGMVGDMPVFVQAAEGAQPWVAAGPAPSDVGPKATPLLPWRYDQREKHFRPRTTLERAHMPADVNDDPMLEGGTAGAGVVPSGTPSSPLFAADVRASVYFDEQTARAVLQPPGDARMLAYDGASWQTVREERSPFDAGANDFFAAAWDSVRQQLVLFDPTTGKTWLRDETSGWAAAEDTGPERWSLSEAIRTEEDLPDQPIECAPEDEHCRVFDRTVTPERFNPRLAQAASELPHMVFDSTRSRIVMLYRGATWQWDGALWTQHPVPPGWESCDAAVLLSHDTARGKTVAIGCTIPGQTWEWDGTDWAGPFPGPYQALIERDDLRNDPILWWKGTLQLPWAHPNAASYSATLGGVAMFDADGTLRVWTGQAWETGPNLPGGFECRVGYYRAEGPHLSTVPWMFFPYRANHFFRQDLFPLCLFPPLVEDAAAHQIWVMRDGAKGMLTLDLDDAHEDRSWISVPDSRISGSRIHPHPFELLSAEHVTMGARTDPSTRVWNDIWETYVPSHELTLQNLWWPYRLLRDDATGRIRLLTSRGQIWEMGTQTKLGLGEVCQNDQECGQGICTKEGVCCDNRYCGINPCSTCLGAVPGTCEAKLGQAVPDPDGNVCTVEICDHMYGGHRVWASAGASCADGDACNGEETCNGHGTCVAGVQPELSDDNPCTADSCDAVAGVVHEPLADGTSCADDNVCNGAETCSAGACVAGAALPIDDGDPCTEDTCDPQTGVAHASLARGAGCVDMQGRDGICNAGGVCFPTSDPAYEDGDPCTYDHAGGHDVLAGFSCEDGDLCNGDETCSASGECVSGVAPVVDDGDPETLDMCDALVGVVHKVPPVIDRTLPTRIAASQAFLFQEPNALQLDVEPGTLVDKRLAILHGSARLRDGSPLQGVRITVLNHDEYGRTNSRPDGRFDMAFEGGGPLTVQYRKRGFLPVDRLVHTHWRRESVIDDVVMIETDTEVTEIDTLSPSTQLALGSTETDSDGTRTAVLAFRSQTGATMHLGDGTYQDLDSLHVRLTEYSVGTAGPRALPATLPALSGYAYAVELSVDEATEAGADEVLFSDPVSLYVDNFLDIPAGTRVPVGYYDRRAGVWKPSPRGIVVDIVDDGTGGAGLDIDGDGVPDDSVTLDAVGIDPDQQGTIASLYEPGDSIWALAVEHFSPYAVGWAYGPPDCAVAPGGKNECDDTPYPLDHPRVDRGPSLTSAIEPTASGDALVYDSTRVPGDKGTHKLIVPLRSEQMPTDVNAVRVHVAIAGRSWSCDYCEGSVYELTWDGEDAYGRPVQGEQLAVVRVGYDYDCVQKDTPQYGVGGASDVTTSVDQAKQGCVATLWREDSVLIGALDPTTQGIGGYSPASYFMYDPDTETMYGGDGTVKSLGRIPSGVQVFAGQDEPGLTDDLIPAADSYLGSVAGIAVDNHGSVYLSDQGNERIVKVREDGLLQTIVTGVSAGNLDVAADGTLYFIEGRQVMQRTQDGTVSVYAGTGDECDLDTVTLAFDCHDGNALDARFQIPFDVVVAADGSVFVSDAQAKVVRQITTAGQIWTVAGSALTVDDVPGDGPATETPLLGVDGISVEPDGTLLVVEGLQHMPWNKQCYRVREVKSGQLRTIAGDCLCPQGMTGCFTELEFPTTMALDRDGTIYVQDYQRIVKIDDDGEIWGTHLPAGDICGENDWNRLSQRAMAVDDKGSLYWVTGCKNQQVMWLPSGPNVSDGGQIRIPSDDGATVRVFNDEGRHLRTVAANTGTLLRKFEHTGDGRLSWFEDQFGSRTTLNRTDGQVTSITGPYGHTTVLERDANGFLNLSWDPAANETSMTYSDEGLLSARTDAMGGPSCTYSSEGHLRLIDEGNGYVDISRASVGDIETIEIKTKMGRTASTATRKTASTVRETITGSDGRETRAEYRGDHTWTVDFPNLVHVQGTEQPDPQHGWEVPRPSVVKTTMPSGKSMTVHTVFDHTPFAGGSSGAPSEDMGPFAALRTKVSVNGWAEPSVTELDVVAKTLKRKSPMGRGVLTELNLAGLPQKVRVEGVGADVLAPIEYEYDVEGQLIRVGQKPGRLLELSYDGGGALREVIDAYTQRTLVRYDNDALQLPYRLTLPDDSVIELVHDEHGNTTSVTPPGRSAHTMAYNSLDQLTTYQPPAMGHPPGTFELFYGYNDDHQSVGMALSGSPALWFEHDVFGRLSSLQTWGRIIGLGYDDSTGQLRSVSAEGQTVTYGVDGVLPLSDIWTGSAEGSIGRTYNDRFELSSETTTAEGSTFEVVYGYDADGLLTSAGDLSVVRDPKIGRIKEIHAGELVETFLYDRYGEISSHAVTKGATNYLTLGYAYDSLGRITQVSETQGYTTQRTTGFGYDLHRGWLDSVVVNGGEPTVYDHDVNGNRRDPGATFDGQDRLTGWNGETLEYDTYGSLKKRSSSTTESTYDYDVWGNLHSVQTTDLASALTTTVEYGTDGRNRRISKSVDGTLQWKAIYRSSLQPAVWIQEEDGSQQVTHFIYATGRNSPDLMVRDGELYRLVVDHVGSVRMVINVATGSVPQRIEYDAWGNIAYEEGTAFQPFGFAGGIVDRDTGLIRFGSRDYDPRLGRWTSRDPLRFDGGSTNLYVYADGDPVNFVDPSGRIAMAAWFLIGMVSASPFVESSSDFAGHVDMIDAGLWASGLGPLAEGVAGRVAVRLAARGGGAIAGAGTKAPRVAPFNPSGSMSNCVNGVCAFLKSVRHGRKFTASADVAENLGLIEKALNQIRASTGVRIGLRGQFNEPVTGHSRQFFVVFRGSSRQVSDHVAVGIVNNGRRLIYDPQIGRTYYNVGFAPIWSPPTTFT